MKTALCAVSALLAAMAVLYASAASDGKKREMALNAVYQRAFYETCEYVSGMENDLSKLNATSSARTQISLLDDLSRRAQSAQCNLALLPVSMDAATATMKFVNQAGDYAETLSARLSAGGTLGEEDRAQLGVLSESASLFASRLDEALTTGVFTVGDAEGVPELLANVPDTSYPTLLYDGPFSDTRLDGAARGPSGDEMTREQAAQALMDFLGDDADGISFTGDAQGETELYEFALRYHGRECSAGVSKKGGRLFYLLPDSAGGESLRTQEECVESAKMFLESRIPGEVQESYYRVYGGVLTLNMVPVESGILLYPDLIKVQVSMSDASVIGLEMKDYYRNHAPRALPEPSIDEAQALALAGARLETEGARMCLIPIRQTEALCYEVRGREGEDEFLLYIDAQTGVEQTLFQLLKAPDGTLAE